jgi:two-component system NtrC family response regulator
MQQICRMIEKIGPSSATVLSLGESGTGKELMAKALHELSTRR